MAKNNLGQPTISDVVTFFCDPCNAVLCAGCPINDILQVEKLPNKVLQRTAVPLCQVCLMPLSEHVFECDVPQTRRR